jgi:hypothetical protein
MIQWLIALGVPSIVISIWIAIWQNQKAKAAEHELQRVLATIPEEVGITVAKVLKLQQKSEGEGAALHGLADPEWPSFMQMVDLNNDGKSELIVQFLAGAHGNAMQVFGWRDHEFVEIASFGAGTPVPFEFGDFDNDGRIEVEVTETDWSVGLPYSVAPRVKVIYRLEKGKFVEVNRKKDYTEAELATLLREYPPAE